MYISALLATTSTLLPSDGHLTRKSGVCQTYIITEGEPKDKSHKKTPIPHTSHSLASLKKGACTLIFRPRTSPKTFLQCFEICKEVPIKQNIAEMS